jgi:hypothetical protein
VSVPVTGDRPALTANLGWSLTHFSPDGEWLATIGREEGNPEVCLTTALASCRQLTFLGSGAAVVGGGDRIVAANAGQPFAATSGSADHREGREQENAPGWRNMLQAAGVVIGGYGRSGQVEALSRRRGQADLDR